MVRRRLILRMLLLVVLSLPLLVAPVSAAAAHAAAAATGVEIMLRDVHLPLEAHHHHDQSAIDEAHNSIDHVHDVPGMVVQWAFSSGNPPAAWHGVGPKTVAQGALFRADRPPAHP